MDSSPDCVGLRMTEQIKEIASNKKLCFASETVAYPSITMSELRKWVRCVPQIAPLNHLVDEFFLPTGMYCRFILNILMS